MCDLIPAVIPQFGLKAGLWALQTSSATFMMGTDGELAKLQKVNTCIMWTGDKLSSLSETMESSVQPFPRIMRMLDDPDEAVVVQAYWVLLRTVTKIERQTVLMAQKKCDPRHIRLFAPTVNAVFGTNLPLIKQLFAAFWNMPYAKCGAKHLPCIEAYGRKPVAAKPIVCLADHHNMWPTLGSRILCFDHYAVHSNMLNAIVGYASTTGLCCDGVTLSYLTIYMADNPVIAQRYTVLRRWLTSEEPNKPLTLPMDTVDVPVPTAEIAEELYAVCRDGQICQELKLALFCNLHSRDMHIDVYTEACRNWSTIGRVGQPEPATVARDDDFASRAVVMFLLHGANCELRTRMSTEPIPYRYTPGMLNTLTIPSRAEFVGESGDSELRLLPLSHSKDEPVAWLPTHEIVIISGETSTAETEWSPCSHKQEHYHENVWFLGRFMPTKTTGRCRWCLTMTAEPTIEVLGCACMGTRLGMSHSTCLCALADKGLMSRKICCACLQEYKNVPVEMDANPAYGHYRKAATEPLLNTWNTVYVGRPVSEPITLRSVSCACCRRVMEPAFWLYLGYPVCLRFDLCGDSCLTAFELSCHNSPVVDVSAIAIYSTETQCHRRLATPRFNMVLDSESK